MRPAEVAASAAALLALDPQGLGGVCLRSPAGAIRDRWLELLRASLPARTPWRRIPSNITVDRLLGDLDWAGTLSAGRPMWERGLLASADGGVLVIAMAERLPAHIAGVLTGVIDCARVTRSGAPVAYQARLGILALDESMADESGPPTSVLDRLSMIVDLSVLDPREAMHGVHDRAAIEAARERLPEVCLEPALIEALCAAAIALGAGSARVTWLACRVAAAAAALRGRTQATVEDAELAGTLVLAPRASRAPAESRDAGAQSREDGSDRPDETVDDADASGGPASAGAASGEQPKAQGADARVLSATEAAIPRGLLTKLKDPRDHSSRGSKTGRTGSLRLAGKQGRPSGCRLATGRGRLHVIETLRAAAPWQKLRSRGPGRPVRILRQDLREQRFKLRSPTLTIFVVDASGSAALNRLAEAKGAVELMLAECYIRRDMVAVIAFRNALAELVLPPTRSLVRAKRALAGLPGGGGTPLAGALASAASLSMQARRRGDTPTIIVLSDGRANIARSGVPGRIAAHADALAAARLVRECRAQSVFIDNSPTPSALAREIAHAMGARYLALPHPGARRLSTIMRAASHADRAESGLAST